MNQKDADAATILRAADYLRGLPNIQSEMRAVAHRLCGRVDLPPLPRARRSVTERVAMNGRVVMVVQTKRAQFGL